MTRPMMLNSPPSFQKSHFKRPSHERQQFSDERWQANDEQSNPTMDSFMEVCISLRDVGIKALDGNAEVEEVEVQSQCPSFSDERCIDELKDSSCAPPSVLSKDSGDDPVIDALVKSLQAIYDRGHSGINCDFMVVPHIHPHARIACEWVPPGSHNGHVWHIFTDGSAKKERATLGDCHHQRGVLGWQTHLCACGLCCGRSQ